MFIKAFLIIFLSLASTASFAQFQTLRTGSILVLDQASLLTQSNLGRAILALEQSEQAEILENGHLVTLELEAEERELTKIRASLAIEDFQVLADAFNDKVEATRASQTEVVEVQKSRVEARRRAFFQFIGPQLAELIQKYSAAAIIDRRTVLLFDKNLDITLETIAVLDAAYAENPEMIDLGN